MEIDLVGADEFYRLEKRIDHIDNKLDFIMRVLLSNGIETEHVIYKEAYGKKTLIARFSTREKADKFLEENRTKTTGCYKVSSILRGARISDILIEEVPVGFYSNQEALPLDLEN